ncbi:MAG: hypothetical protein ACTSRZ_20640 [Promethearchaeota archaeon]
MTQPSDEAKRIFQGDIFCNQIIITIPPNIQIIRKNKNEEYRVFKLEELPDAFTNKELIIVYAIKSNIIVLSQTCDIEHREFISIAPVFPLTNINNIDKINSLKNNKVNYRFYIPESKNLEESYAELTLIHSIPKEYLKLENRISSLSDYSRHLLQDQLNRYFCRPFVSEEKPFFIFPNDSLSKS